MRMEFTRRDFVKFIPSVLALSFVPKIIWAADLKIFPGHSGHNFKYIYENEKLREQYHLFLQNVYSLYPDPETHNLILELTSSLQSDEAIYKELQKRLPDIKPFLSIITASLPALIKQKHEMHSQTDKLISNMKTANGYMEIGTTGRYVGGIKSAIDLDGPIYLLNTTGPTYNPGDVVERGHIFKVGTYIDMGDYTPISADVIKPQSLDLVSNYIGFHHAPPDHRDEFIKSVVDTLRPGGKLVLRDHDASNDDMKFMAALAHDVFNAGLDVSWEKNLAEIRNFTSISEIADKVSSYGVTADSSRLLQAGDPTKNTLMVFTKT